ncbi:hypothetical protein F5Y07DRAFT_314440 [Xylaria sp. FL0933]|nr:hypothetical protein F5Y07DRAFT_314440 [Xylaria sp. FL0933]
MQAAAATALPRAIPVQCPACGSSRGGIGCNSPNMYTCARVARILLPIASRIGSKWRRIIGRLIPTAGHTLYNIRDTKLLLLFCPHFQVLSREPKCYQVVIGLKVHTASWGGHATTIPSQLSHTVHFVLYGSNYTIYCEFAYPRHGTYGAYRRGTLAATGCPLGYVWLNAATLHRVTYYKSLAFALSPAPVIVTGRASGKSPYWPLSASRTTG